MSRKSTGGRIIEAVTQVRYRRSRIRTSILDYLHTTQNHPSAEDVHEAVRESHPQVSFGTVYRNLNILVDQGEAVRIESSRGRDHFDITDSFHGHFQCENCGRIIDIPLPEEVLTNARNAAEEAGHSITGHQVAFTGVCADCAKLN